MSKRPPRARAGAEDGRDEPMTARGRIRRPGSDRQAGAAMHLELYIAGRSPNSLRALENLRAVIGTASTQPRIDVIDVLMCPMEALAARIIVTPTLVRVNPGPVIRIVGDLSNRQAVIDALGAMPTKSRP